MNNLDMLIPQPVAPDASWLWATVTQASPLRVRLDGETAAQDATPDTLVANLTVGERVWVALVNRRLIVVGRADGIDGAWRGEDGKKYRMVAGVIRNDGSPNYWQLIATAGHASCNVDSVSTSTSWITLDYTSIGALNVVSFVVSADETLLAAGYQAGVSVTLTSANINLKHVTPYADYVYYQSTGTPGWYSANGVFTLAYDSGTGILTCTHPKIPTTSGTGVYNMAVNARTGVLMPVMYTVIDTALKIQWQTYAATPVVQTTPSTAQRAFISHGGSGPIDPQQLDTTVHPYSNLWFMGVFEVA